MQSAFIYLKEYNCRIYQNIKLYQSGCNDYRQNEQTQIAAGAIKLLGNSLILFTLKLS